MKIVLQETEMDPESGRSLNVIHHKRCTVTFDIVKSGFYYRALLKKIM